MCKKNQWHIQWVFVYVCVCICGCVCVCISLQMFTYIFVFCLSCLLVCQYVFIIFVPDNDWQVVKQNVKIYNNKHMLCMYCIWVCACVRVWCRVCVYIAIMMQCYFVLCYIVFQSCRNTTILHLPNTPTQTHPTCVRLCIGFLFILLFWFCIYFHFSRCHLHTPFYSTDVIGFDLPFFVICAVIPKRECERKKKERKQSSGNIYV